MERYRELIYRYYNDLFKLDHVVGVGYGVKERKGEKTAERAIVVLVDKKVPKKKLSPGDIIPQAVGDYQTDVIEVGDIQLLNTRTQRMRPAQPGVSIGHYKVSAGTLGAVVRDRNSGLPLILSNNHVLANIAGNNNDRAKIGDPILQPGAYDGGNESSDVIGHLERYIPIVKEDNEIPGCPLARAFERLLNSFLHLVRPDYKLKLVKSSYGNLVDCAVAKPVNKNDINPEILEVGSISGVDRPEPGMKIKKSGRTSGLTVGLIKTIYTTIQVKMSETETAVFHNQFVTGPISAAGDSGSLVLDEDNRAVGLLFAGSDKATVCNWIEYVLAELDVEF
ncbi:MAG: hypothetical protein ACOCQN_01200 [Halanaerobiaceae bacterium]